MNAPPLWQVGINDELEKLQQEGSYEKVIDQIIDQAHEIKKAGDFQFYRVRSCSFGNGEFDSTSQGEFDSPPNKLKNNDRFDSPNFSVLYGSTDLQSCLHECRVTLEDIIFVAKLSPRRELKLLDLIDFPHQSGLTPHESLEAAVDMLFYAGECSYEITRQIAIKAEKKGFDGLIYPSYINNLQNKEYNTSTLGIPNFTPVEPDQRIQNLAIFGRPILEGKLQVSSINRVFLRQSSYVIKFGPACI
ncbi:MAG: RES family NAD+ phosphorylase [Paracoccaceae bacterium]|nr:RES family NAD+ phosphorylase [Paracoccaceae bacterium]